jgi:hypothetical protein
MLRRAIYYRGANRPQIDGVLSFPFPVPAASHGCNARDPGE